MDSLTSLWDRIFGRPDAGRGGTAVADPPMDEASEGGRGPSNLEQAGPALASVLRALGEHAFDADVPARVAREKYAAWADHVESGAAPPDRPGARRGRLWRDWSGVRTFAAERRRAEKTHVEESARALRETLWAFIQRLTAGLAADRRSDARVDDQLRRLRAAVDDPSIDNLRREALGAVDTIRALVEERAARQQKNVEDSAADLNAAREELARVRHEATIDPLTQLHNRGAFDEQIETCVALKPLTSTMTTLLMVDVDHFRQVNDVFGHTVGDEVLKRLADCMMRVLMRRSDFVARYGGEEFAILLQQDDLSSARILAQKLLAAVRGIVLVAQGQEIRPRISIGVAEIYEGESAADWIARADHALYEAKRAGRDRLVEADPPPTGRV